MIKYHTIKVFKHDKQNYLIIIMIRFMMQVESIGIDIEMEASLGNLIVMIDTSERNHGFNSRELVMVLNIEIM